MAPAGIREVAAHAGVSIGTVSNFLNHPDRLSAAMVRRVTDAIEAVGFVPSNAARQLRMGVSSVIGYLASDIGNPHFGEIAASVQSRASELGLSVFIADAQEDQGTEDAHLDAFAQHHVRGLLVASHHPVEERLALLRRRGTPSVLVGQRAVSEEQPSVSVDEVDGGRQAVAHLADVGCRTVAFVGGPSEIVQVSARLAGAERAAGERGLRLREIPVAERSVAAGREVGALIAALPRESRPDGVFAVNDLLALGILQELVGRGVRVPEELALIGYDDTEFAEASLIPLSSVSRRHRDVGELVVDALFATIRGRSPDRLHRVLKPRLMPRRSTQGFLST
ncbi:LacI family DNA-binding transcriptional regulator [Microbacterium sp. CIAB417]|uniref:LacI family DNA-binding transcriptional regulator n=1 Tax=Microbacterium sp. CIAB417 TaxID=2860287 RepID=UPI001FADB22D|nr:LacI family DNA-binding transcriptional regulator [Microbacterium sp. CIAB417]